MLGDRTVCVNKYLASFQDLIANSTFKFKPQKPIESSIFFIPILYGWPIACGKAILCANGAIPRTQKALFIHLFGICL